MTVPGPAAHRSGAGRSSSRTPRSHRLCDDATAALILFMTVFTPWAFGTTQPWAVTVMNYTAFALGALLLAKWVIRWQTGFRPPRWDQEGASEAEDLIQIRQRDPFAMILAGLTVFILLYILVGVINARATFIDAERRFDYFDCINWLPHSYARNRSWRAFVTYAGLACFFWAARDWLLSKGGSGRRKRKHRDQAVVISPASSAGVAEESTETHAGSTKVGPYLVPRSHGSGAELPYRLRLLLWVLCINGAILALEAILQRLSGTNKLLWIREPLFNLTPDSQFGPYAYRANAASFFNLVWPVSLGFWMLLRQSASNRHRISGRIGTSSHIMLLPGAVLMAACPIISTTRGGAVVAVLSICLMMGLVIWSTRKESIWFRVGTCSLFGTIIVFSGFLGYRELAARFKTIFTDQMSNRLEIYEHAKPMAKDFPVLGTGAGTFGALYQLYRSDINQDWAAHVHDDWLETRITFGWVGFLALVGMLGMAVGRWFVQPGIPADWEFVSTFWVALGGTLLHAKFDFPLQVYSILFLFLLLLATLSTLARPASS